MGIAIGEHHSWPKQHKGFNCDPCPPHSCPEYRAGILEVHPLQLATHRLQALIGQMEDVLSQGMTLCRVSSEFEAHLGQIVATEVAHALQTEALQRTELARAQVFDIGSPDPSTPELLHIDMPPVPAFPFLPGALCSPASELAKPTAGDAEEYTQLLSESLPEQFPTLSAVFSGDGSVLTASNGEHSHTLSGHSDVALSAVFSGDETAASVAEHDDFISCRSSGSSSSDDIEPVGERPSCLPPRQKWADGSQIATFFSSETMLLLNQLKAAEAVPSPEPCVACHKTSRVSWADELAELEQSFPELAMRSRS